MAAGRPARVRSSAPLFTPATKADTGHDENISEAAAAAVVGEALLARLKTLTLALYAAGVAHAESCGIILADTKFEFGLTDAGDLLLIDEVMTPDSSRYWPKDQYAPGGAQPSFDKQFVRDYLESIKWNKQPPCPCSRRGLARATSTRRLPPADRPGDLPARVRESRAARRDGRQGHPLRGGPARVREASSPVVHASDGTPCRRGGRASNTLARKVKA
jgi:hypothetical protein